MKADRILSLLPLLGLFAISQLTNAQLARQTIDEELLSEMVQAKQEEVKQRLLHNLVSRNIRTTNNATFNTMYDLVDVLLTEKNSTRMTEAIVHKVADYSIAYALSWHITRTMKDTLRVKNTKKKTETYVFNKYTFHGLQDTLRKYYKDIREGKSGPDGERRAREVIIDSKTPFLIGYYNWMLDEVYKQLATNEKLHRWGLFLGDSTKGWQYIHGPKYKDFWNTWDPDNTVQTLLKKHIRTHCSDFATKGYVFSQIYRAVGGDSSSFGGTLVKLDLSTLASIVPNVAPVHTESTATDQVLSWSGDTVAIANASNGNERIALVFELFQKSIELYREEVGQNALVVKLADLITKYVILDPQVADPLARFGFSIDIEAIILSLEDKIMQTTNSPVRNAPLTIPDCKIWPIKNTPWPFTWVGLNARAFFTIGLNYAYFSGLDSTFASEVGFGNISQVAYAAEKFGVRWRLFDWRYTHSQEVGQWFKYHGRYYTRSVRPNVPLISHAHLMAYGSGLLYTIADLRTESTFNYAMAGAGAGITFFNDLELNVTYAIPIIPESTPKERIDAGFWNVAFDIPIFQYIREARAKRGR